MDPQKDNQPQPPTLIPQTPTPKNCSPTRIQAWMVKNPQRFWTTDSRNHRESWDATSWKRSTNHVSRLFLLGRWKGGWLVGWLVGFLCFLFVGCFCCCCCFHQRIDNKFILMDAWTSVSVIPCYTSSHLGLTFHIKKTCQSSSVTEATRLTCNIP